VVVTGANGFVGGRLLPALLARGCEVWAVVRDPSRLPSRPGLRVVAGDLRSGPPPLAGARSLVHLAAARDQPGRDPRELVAVNVTATLELARAAAEEGLESQLFLGTTRMFGPTAPGTRGHEETSPLDLAGRSGGYAASRAAATAALRRLQASGAPLLLLHAPILFGPDRAGYRNRVTAELRRALAGRPCPLVAGGRAPRDLLHVDDLVSSLLSALEKRPSGLEAILTGEPSSHRELLRAACAAAGRRPPRLISVPAPLALLAGAAIDRWKRYHPATGMRLALDNLRREWRCTSSRAALTIGHSPRPLAQRIGEVARQTEEER
jgi:nucleoside-diphosphate-sugar epimerase